MLIELAEAENDSSLAEEIDGSLDEVEELLDQLEFARMLGRPDDKADAIVTINAKEASMAVGTLEKICTKLDCNIVLGNGKDKPMSPSDAADLIAKHGQFSLKRWRKERIAIFGLTSSSAGSKIDAPGIIASTLTGYLGKDASLL